MFFSIQRAKAQTHNMQPLIINSIIPLKNLGSLLHSPSQIAEKQTILQSATAQPILQSATAQPILQSTKVQA